MIAYNADSGNLFGSLGHYPAANHSPGTMRDIFDWDSGVYLGKIPEAEQTYNVVGNMNEYGLSIGETTFGGLGNFSHQPGAIMDYGSLIWVTLQRSKNAREAIKTASTLMADYGYASDGESFSIADPDEVWLMEIMSKGPGEKGAVWVATKITDGMVSGHANQARTTTFIQDDEDRVQFAPDVVTFAQRKGLYPTTATAAAFDFSAAYDPINFAGARLADARVWGMMVRAEVAGIEQYLDYVKGDNLEKYGATRMPLMFTPGHKVSLNDTMWIMRTHFEGTWFDNSGEIRPDVGAGPESSRYRWRPLEWQFQGKHYVNERTVGVQQTAWNFVSHMRGWLPQPLAGVTWWAPDDSSMALRVPFYGAATAISPGFGDPIGQLPAAAVSYGVKADAGNMNLDSAFWVWNLVANYAYDRSYAKVAPVIQAKINEVEQDYMTRVAANDAVAKAQSPEEAVKTVTAFSVAIGTESISTWRNFWMSLFQSFRDGFTVTPPVVPTCTGGNTHGCTCRPIPDAAETGYSAAWYTRILADGDNAEHYGVPAGKLDAASLHKIARFDKKARRSL